MKIEPTFEIDEKGRVICREHPRYHYFIEPNKDYFEDLSLDIEITCISCKHYFENDCYFSKARIDEIESRRTEKKPYKCMFCGSHVHRMQSVVYKIYNLEIYNLEIPLICCNCYDNIMDGDFIRYSKKRIIVDIFLMFFLAYSFYIFLYLLDAFEFMPFLIVLWLIPWSLIVFMDLKRFKYSISGLVYYKKYFADTEVLIKGKK